MKIKKRCFWAESDPLMARYHDQEWGVALHNDRRLFEFLTLECFQAGLSWLTILKKRENFRRAFAGFDIKKVSRFNSRKVASLLKDPGIIRNRLKILAAISNAQRFMEVQQEMGSFDRYIWGFVNHRPIQNRWRERSQLPATTPLSDALSKDLKKRGFKFVGSTVIYAHMQATGMVNDHMVDCFRYRQVSRKKK